MILQFIRLLRPSNYIKNLFIYAPLIFSLDFSFDTILINTIIFLLFSISASSIYIFNDLNDINEDRRHPTKSKRPIASGKVSKNKAIIVFICLISISLSISFIFIQNLFFIILIYFTMNILYSIKLKHIPIIDISIISLGFVIRLYAGTAHNGYELSIWIIIMTFLLALFLAIAKRRDDVILAIEGKSTRKNIEGYNLEFVNVVMGFLSGIIIVAYILYTVSPEIILKFQTQNLYVTSIFVILGILRYLQITFVEQNSGDPVSIVLNDKFLILSLILWFMTFMVLII